MNWRTTMSKCEQTCEVFSRVVGYHRPVSNWNNGKKAEFNDRKVYEVPKMTEEKKEEHVCTDECKDDCKKEVKVCELC